MDLRSGPVRNRELKLKKADGSIIWVLGSVTWVTYRGEKALLSTVVDNTNGKLAEEALKEAHSTLDAQVKERTSELRRANERLSEEIVIRKRAVEGLQKSESLLQTILDRIPAAIFLKDQDGTYQIVNSTFEQWYDSGPRHSLGKTPYDHFSRDEADLYAEYDRMVLKGKAPIEEQRKVSYPDGRIPIGSSPCRGRVAGTPTYTSVSASTWQFSEPVANRKSPGG